MLILKLYVKWYFFKVNMLDKLERKYEEVLNEYNKNS